MQSFVRDRNMADKKDFLQYINGTSFNLRVLRDFGIVEPDDYQQMLAVMSDLTGKEFSDSCFMNVSADVVEMLVKHIQIAKNPLVKSVQPALRLFEPETDFSILSSMILPLRLKQMERDPLAVKDVGSRNELIQLFCEDGSGLDHIHACTSLIVDAIQQANGKNKEQINKIADDFKPLMKGIPEFCFFHAYSDLLPVAYEISDERAQALSDIINAYGDCFNTQVRPISAREMCDKAVALTSLAEKAVFYNPRYTNALRIKVFDLCPDILNRVQKIANHAGQSLPDIRSHMHKSKERE